VGKSGKGIERGRRGLRPIFYPEDGGSMLLRNFRSYLPDSTALHPRKYYSSREVIASEISKSFLKGNITRL
jgi:hypothetical protein